jgi:hypothetical protein
MGSARDLAVKGYIRLPKAIRSHTDPLIRNRAKTQMSLEKHAEKGRKILGDRLRTIVAGRRKRR